MTPVNERRTNRPRRGEDMDGVVAKWVVWVLQERARLASAVAVITFFLTGAGGLYAMRFTDPARNISRIEIRVDSAVNRIDTLAAQVRQVRVEVALGSVERAEMKGDLREITYMLCDARIERNPHAFLPDVCNKRPKR